MTKINDVESLQITCRIIDPRTLLLTGDFVEEVEKIGHEKLNREKIIKLKHADGISVEEENTITLKGVKYKVQGIMREGELIGPNTVYKIHTVLPRVNKTSQLLFPFLGYDREYFKWSSYFLGAFVGTEEYGDYGNSLYLYYRFNGTTEYMAFESFLESHPCYTQHWDTDDYHVLYEYSIPEGYIGDFNLILQGKYSEISPKAKNRILTFHRSNEQRPIGQILSRSTKRRKKLERDLGVEIDPSYELWDPFDPDEEIFLNRYRI